jgi:TP901 family phage tail tape measure protein
VARNSIDVVVKGDYDDKAINRAIKDLERMQAASESTTKKINDFGQEMQKAGEKISSVGKTLTLGVTLPIVGIGTAAVMASADFETTMNTLQVNANASAESMESLSKLALKMGADTVFSAGEAADAMLELSKGGLTVADIEAGALAATMNLAATEGMALADAATIISNAMNTFEVSAADTNKVVDILAAGAVASTAGVQDLALALKFVGSTANTMGLPLSDVITALAALNNAGIDSSTAGTSLNRMLLGLVPTTEKSGKIMDAFGLSFTNAAGEIMPFEQIVAKLVDTFGDLPTEERIPFLKAIFGVEGMRAANILIEQGVQGFNDLNTAVTKTGIAADLANARMSGTAGAIEALKGSIDSVLIMLGDVLAPTIQSIANFLTEMTNRFAALDPDVQRFIVQFAAIAAAIGPVLFIVGKLIAVIGGIVAAINPVTLAIAGIVAAVALLAAGFVYLWNNSETLRDTVAEVWATIQQVIGRVVGEVKRVLEENRETIERLRAGFQAFVDFLMAYVVPFLVTFIGNYLKAFIEVLGFIVTTIIRIISAFVQFVAKLIEVGAIIVQYVALYIETFQKFWTAIFDGITSTFNTVKDFIKGIFDSIYNTIVDTIRNAVNFVIRGINRIINAWNGLSFSIPEVTVPFLGTVGGQRVGVAQLPNIPELADGGIVYRPTLAMIGEAGPEAVVPLSRGGGMGTTINLTVNAGMGTDGAEVGRLIVDALRQYQRRNGPVPISVTS